MILQFYFIHEYMCIEKNIWEMQDFFFLNLGIAKNMKPTDVSWYLIPGKAYWLRHINANTRRCLVMSLCLIRGMKKFDVLNKIIHLKCHFNIQIFLIQFYIYFYVDQLITYHMTIWKTCWPLTVDCFGYNEESINFFHIF